MKKKLYIIYCFVYYIVSFFKKKMELSTVILDQAISLNKIIYIKWVVVTN